jgi:O-antigen/teichoic acid export membrane protein
VISRSGERWLSAGQDLVHWAWLAGVSSFLSLLVGAPYVVHVFAGPRFHEAIAPLRILGGSVPAIALSSALTALCVARGYAKMLGAISASMLALNVIANIVVIPRFGIVGSAWATTACEYLGLALVALHFAHRSSIAVGKLHRVAGIALAVVISLGCAYLIRGWSLSLTHFAVGQLGVMGIFVIAVTVTGYLPRTLVMWMIGGRHHQPMWWHRVIDPRGFYRRSQA